MLREATNVQGPVGQPGGKPAPHAAGCSHVRPLPAGQPVPWADLGKLRAGQRKQHGVVVHNATAVEQALAVALPGEGFELADAAGATGGWRVPAGGSVALTLSLALQKEGRVRGVLVFTFGDGTEAGRLAVSAAVLPAAGGAGSGAAPAGLAARAQPRPALGAQRAAAMPAAAPRLPQAQPPPQQQQQQQQGGKRMRSAAGVPSPRQPAAAPAAEQLGTPSVQQAKRARELGPFAAGGAGRRAAAPDPATPRHAVLRRPTEQPPGSVEDATPGAAPAVPRLQLGRVGSSPAAAGAVLGSSRFAQELTAAAQPSARGPVPSAAAMGPNTFTHFHTSLWMDKQEAAFKAWLNTILLPEPAAGGSGSSGGGRQGGALASRRLAAKVRGLLWRIYQRDEQFRDAMLRVEERVMGGALRMRDEEAVLKNLKEQAKVKEVLLSYHPFWLRLGMEVVANRVAASGDAVVSASDLEAFMRDWFLRDPDLARRHAPNKAVNGLQPKAYWVQLGQLVLSRLLLLVALLDRAATTAALPQGVPLLFNLRSKLKGSAQVLLAILPGWLSGEGDVLRSLGRLGYRLGYEQAPKREVDFAISNLAVDLRDGLRLCRLADILTGTGGLFEQARFPADKRPVKLHNVQLALGQFVRCGCSLDGIKTLKGVSALAPADVIDGDREKTLALLWRLILHFQLPLLVSPAAVRIEIDRIYAAAAELMSSSNSEAAAAGPAAAASGDLARDHMGLLLQWAQAVCVQYGVAVPNFTSAFADGHVFCLLVNYYLGNAYLPLKEIYVPSPEAQRPQAPAASGGSAGSSSDEDEDAGGWEARHQEQAAGDPAAAAAHRAGVASNFGLVQRVTEALGSIPAMVSAADILEHGPDEKALVLFTAFLCQRLMEVSREERAAMVMQRLWRRRQAHRPGTAREHLHKWIAAAAVVQRAVRAWLLRRGLEQFAARRRRCAAAVARLQAIWWGRPARQQFLQLRQAALCIQAAYRGKLGRRRAFQEVLLPAILARGLEQKRQIERSRYQGRLLAAAVTAQALRRGSVARREFLRQRSAAVVVQASVRRHQATSRFRQLRAAAVVLQSHWRRRQAMQLLQRTKAAIAIQKVWRGRITRTQLAAQHAAAVTIQSAWRGYSQRRSYQQQRQAAITIQRHWRGHAARAQLATQQAAASVVAIQRVWRGHTVRQQVEQQHQAATAIQAAWRRHTQRQRFLRLRAGVVLMQSLARRKAAQQRFRRQRQAAIVLQAHARGALARAALRRQRAAALRLQAWWRQHLARRRFCAQRQAAVVLQAHVRSMQARRCYQRLQGAAIALQAAWRARQARLLLQQHRAALAVQRLWRGYAVRSRVVRQRAAAVRLQAAWRRCKARAAFLRTKRAAVVLQAAVRMHQSRRRLAEARRAATTIQAAWRAAKARALLQRMRREQAAAVALQRVWRGHRVRASLRQQRAAAVRLQAAWRAHVARATFLRQRQAAVAVQAAWRGFATRRLLQRTQAAVVIQRHARGFLVRRHGERQLAAAVLIQRCYRQHLDWKRQQAIAAMKRQMEELARTMQLYHQRVVAALRIQTIWRGYKARLLFAAMLAEHRERQRLQQEREAAARAVIARWAATFRDRTWFLRARRATRVLQRWWHAQFARRQAAAVKLQAAAQRFLAMRRLQRSQRAAARIQASGQRAAAWRGYHQRATHPKAKRLAELRRRLRQAYAGAVGQAHRSLAARTRVGLQGLLASAHLSAAAPSMEALALSLESSRHCCDMVAEGGGTAALLRLVQSAGAGRDKGCLDGLRWALLCLAHLCRYRPYAEAVFSAEGLLQLLGEQLVATRDKEEVFLAAAALLQRLVADAGRAQALSRMPEVTTKYEGAARMLALRLGQESKYLAKLEGQKGSDVSARQSTRALVSLTRQLSAIEKVLAATGAPPLVAAVAPASPGEGGMAIGKNTIVRRTLAEMQGHAGSTRR